MLSHIRRNRKRTETERRTENVHKLDFIFFGFGGRISANTTGNFDSICTYTATWVVYNLVIMKSLMDCPARQLCDYFTSTILQSTAFCGTRPRATIKTTKLWQCHGTFCIVKEFLLSEREISPDYTGNFLDFVHRFGSYVKGLPKTKRCNLVAVTVSVWIPCICETSLTIILF